MTSDGDGSPACLSGVSGPIKGLGDAEEDGEGWKDGTFIGGVLSLRLTGYVGFSRLRRDFAFSVLSRKAIERMLRFVRSNQEDS